jgi:hypothetical protein
MFWATVPARYIDSSSKGDLSKETLKEKHAGAIVFPIESRL